MARAGLGAVLRRAVGSGDVPGVVAAVSDRRGIVYHAAFGTAGGGRALREDAVFRIASMTKPVTSLAVMMLCEEGRMALEQPLADCLPGYAQPPVLADFDAGTGRYRTRPAQRRVTVHHLLSHTSGYGYWFLDAPLARLTRGAADVLRPPPFLMHEPGSRFAYGASTDVLGRAVEALSGTDLERFFRERIFAPLGMHETAYSPPAEADRLVQVHRRAAGAFAEEANERHGPPPRGGGGLYATAEDYLALLRLFLNGGAAAGGDRLVGAATIDAMTGNRIGGLRANRQVTALPEQSNDFLFMDGSQKFGYGFLLETRRREGGRAPGSYGWGGILNTHFWVDPAAGLACVLMTQLAPFCDPACIDLLERFERAVYAAWRGKA